MCQTIIIHKVLHLTIRILYLSTQDNTNIYLSVELMMNTEATMVCARNMVTAERNPCCKMICNNVLFEDRAFPSFTYIPYILKV